MARLSAGSRMAISGMARMRLMSSRGMWVPPLEAAEMPASPPMIFTLAPW